MSDNAIVLDPNLMATQPGVGWSIRLSSAIGPGDTNDSEKSTLLLFEDDRPLGPPHSLHDFIFWDGNGAYSHWHDTLYFSTSDGSDPRNNGRRYRVFADWGPDLPRFDPETHSSAADEARLLRLSTRRNDALDLILFLNRLGIYVRPSAKILDFGCGTGKGTYQIRDLGFDAYGCDIYDRVQYRCEEDREFFAFSERPGRGTDYTIDNNYAIRFPDDFFDVVFSGSVLEHVQDLDAVMQECARVVKRTGIVVHCYPGKYQLIEPHIYIPLGSFFAPDWWLRLWSPNDSAGSNLDYVRTGIKYRSRRNIRAISRRHFEQVDIYSTTELYPNVKNWQRIKGIAKALRDPEPLAALGRTVLLKALVCEGKKRRV